MMYKEKEYMWSESGRTFHRVKYLWKGNGNKQFDRDIPACRTPIKNKESICIGPEPPSAYKGCRHCGLRGLYWAQFEDIPDKKNN